MSSENKKINTFILFLSAFFLFFTGCNNKSVSRDKVYRELGYTQNSQVLDLSEILDEVGKFPENIIGSNLITYLAGHNLTDTQKEQASYVLARLLYKQLSDIDNHSDSQIIELSQVALDLFNTSVRFKSLQNLSLYHKAQIYNILGKEKLVRENLYLILLEDKDNPKYNYELGQSFIRSCEPDKALNIFLSIVTNYPNTNYGIGSLYYLGLIAENKGITSQSLNYYLKYLMLEPLGRFSQEILDKLISCEKKLNLTNSDEYNACMVKVYINKGDFKKALNYIKKIKKQDYFYEKSYIYAKLNQPDMAIDVLYNGLSKNVHNGKSLTDLNFKAVAYEISSHLNHADTIVFWQKLEKLNLKDNLPVILYNLAKRDKSSLNYYHKILSLAPKSEYANYAAFIIDFNEYLKARHNKVALNKLKVKFIDDYNLYQNCPKKTAFLFWLGKICLATGDKSNAKKYFTIASKIVIPDYYVCKSAFELAKINKQKQFDLPYPYFKPLKTFDWNIPRLRDLSNSEEIIGVYGEVINELGFLHQFNECLSIMSETVNANSFFKAWLLANTADYHKCIDMAVNLQNKPLDSDPKWQLSYPMWYLSVVKNCAKNNNLNPYFVFSIIREESRFDANAVSSSNAYGLMQLLPTTAGSIAKKLNFKITSANMAKALCEPSVNINFGCNYLNYLLKLFKGNLIYTIGSYNGGPGAMQGWIKQATAKGYSDDVDVFIETIPVSESRNYIKKVLSSFWSYSCIYK